MASMVAEISTLPEFETQNFARWIYEAAEKYFENPEVMARYKKWRTEQQQHESEKKATLPKQA